jgi:hypothetical protein
MRILSIDDTEIMSFTCDKLKQSHISLSITELSPI